MDIAEKLLKLVLKDLMIFLTRIQQGQTSVCVFKLWSRLTYWSAIISMLTSSTVDCELDLIRVNKYQFYSLWFEPIRARTHDLPHMRQAH